MLVDFDDSNKPDDTIFYNNNAQSDFSPSSRLFREHTDLATGDGAGDDLDIRAELWGDAYPFKPVAQDRWDDRVRTAAVSAAAVDVPETAMTADPRPRAYDYNTRRWMLLDSGAAVSCFPRAHFPQSTINPNQILQAVNGEKIATYGTQKIKINLGGNTFEHDFVIADISEIILGWNFLARFRLDIVWRGKKCLLKSKNKTFPLCMQKARARNVNLAIVTYFRVPNNRLAPNNRLDAQIRLNS